MSCSTPEEPEVGTLAAQSPKIFFPVRLSPNKKELDFHQIKKNFSLVSKLLKP